MRWALFAGVHQVNFQVPAGAPSGTQTLVVSAGNLAGPAVRIPIR